MIDLIGLPAFIWTVFVMYWSLPFLWMFGYLKPFDLTGLRNPPWGWAEGLGRFFKVKVLKINETKVYDGGKAIFLCNHRSWADFFMDVYMTDGRGMMLSRMAVLYVFPMFMIPVRAIRGVILFKRGRIVDKEAFNAGIDKELEESPHCGLIVYPEGHRSTKSESLPLKRGMLYYAHSRGLPVQVVMTRNKEHMISEKRITARFGVTLAVAHSEVVRSADYPGDSNGFMAKVQETWDQTWALAYAANLEGLPEYQPRKLDTTPPRAMRVSFLALSLLVTCCFLATLAALGWAVVQGLGLLPPTGQAITVGALLLWCVVSYFHVQMPPIGGANKPSAAAVTNGASSAPSKKSL